MARARPWETHSLRPQPSSSNGRQCGALTGKNGQGVATTIAGKTTPKLTTQELEQALSDGGPQSSLSECWRRSGDMLRAEEVHSQRRKNTLGMLPAT